MAIAKKCDRCGKYYDPYNLKIDEKFINTIAHLFVDGKSGRSHDEKIIEICPECCEAFMKWLKDPTMMVIYPTSVLGVKVDDDWMNKPQPD